MMHVRASVHSRGSVMHVRTTVVHAVSTVMHSSSAMVHSASALPSAAVVNCTRASHHPWAFRPWHRTTHMLMMVRRSVVRSMVRTRHAGSQTMRWGWRRERWEIKRESRCVVRMLVRMTRVMMVLRPFRVVGVVVTVVPLKRRFVAIHARRAATMVGVVVMAMVRVRVRAVMVTALLVNLGFVLKHQHSVLKLQYLRVIQSWPKALEFIYL